MEASRYLCHPRKARSQPRRSSSSLVYHGYSIANESMSPEVDMAVEPYLRHLGNGVSSGFCKTADYAFMTS